jgi:hypothetical protein
MLKRVTGAAAVVAVMAMTGAGGAGAAQPPPTCAAGITPTVVGTERGDMLFGTAGEDAILGRQRHHPRPGR